MYNFVKKLKYVSMNVQITNAFSETYPNYSIDYRLFHLMKRIEYILVKKKYVYLTRA